MTSDMSPDPGPSPDTAYVPGRPGADWTDEEIESTRYRILQAIHPDWGVQYDMFGGNKNGRDGVTENRILRLVFHDCVKYTGSKVSDGSIEESKVLCFQMDLVVVMDA